MMVYFDKGKTVKIEPLNDSFSNKWYQEVRNIYKNGIRENNRIYGFNNEWTYDKCLNKIKENIKV